MVQVAGEGSLPYNVDVFVRNWGLVALRGAVAVVFGLVTLLFPTIGLAALVLLFGAYAIASGVLTVATVLSRRREEPHWIAELIGGALSIVVGVLAFAMPGVTVFSLLMLIAAWAIAIGVAEIGTAIRLRKVITDEWLMIVTGVVSVIFGIVLVAYPGLGALGMVLTIGAYAVLAGALLIGLAFRLRSWGREHPIVHTPREA